VVSVNMQQIHAPVGEALQRLIESHLQQSQSARRLIDLS
jgi:hypothetical protein